MYLPANYRKTHVMVLIFNSLVMTRDEFIINNIDKLSRDEIAEYLKIKKNALSTNILRLRKKGLLPDYKPQYEQIIEVKAKICNVCFTEKPLELFHKQKISKDGYRAVCKECRAMQAKETNPITWIKRKKKISESPDLQAKLSIKGRVYRYNNNKELKEKKRKYQQSKSGELKIYIKEYTKKRRRDDENYRIQRNWMKRIWDALNNICCSEETQKVLGCNSFEFRKHIEAQLRDGMNWENYGKKGIWELDWIRPVSVFNLKNYSELCLCFHYTNLQPLFINENMAKFNHNTVLSYKP